MTGDSPSEAFDLTNSSEPSLDDYSSSGTPAIATVFTIVRLCLAIFGVLANTVTGVVLTHRKLWSPTSMLLLSLVAYDAVFLLASIPVSFMGVVITIDLETFAVIFGICYPLRFMAQTGSIYTTVTVTVERFLIVLRPLKARGFCTFGKTRRVILAIFLFSILFNIPRCFFYQLATSFAPIPLSNVTTNTTLGDPGTLNCLDVIDKSHPKLIMVNNSPDQSQVPTSLIGSQSESVSTLILSGTSLDLTTSKKHNPEESRYLSGSSSLPSSLLSSSSSLNSSPTTSSSPAHVNSPKPTDMEDGLTMIVLGITVCFFICCLVPAVYNVTQIAEVPPTTDLSTYLLIASDTMLCVNASTDFFFYCLLGRRFRNIFLYLFCTKRYLAKRHGFTGSRYRSRGNDSYYQSV
ncbi:FMRFamide receptor [Plakobranchus ocellatus]|uniref:FMRFamide receptor n=1 Tax=Plakobranchus ocellatus TaxID=259542 RepID=A0AAV4C599_9GAST|nr:FMRFamide receptor [Plakobranchus ocellatus]